MGRTHLTVFIMFNYLPLVAKLHSPSIFYGCLSFGSNSYTLFILFSFLLHIMSKMEIHINRIFYFTSFTNVATEVSTKIVISLVPNVNGPLNLLPPKPFLHFFVHVFKNILVELPDHYTFSESRCCVE